MEEARGHDAAELPHKGQRSHSHVHSHMYIHIIHVLQ